MVGSKAVETDLSRTVSQILEELRSRTNEANVAGMARFGIRAPLNFGVSVTDLRKIARPFGKNEVLAEELWSQGYRETRILATLIGDPKQISEACMDAWVADLDSWDICDACCMNLFDRTPFAWSKPEEWAARPEEYVRRAAFALIAALAVHDKKAEHSRFLPFLKLAREAAEDRRNFVRKAVLWALRSIAKRSAELQREATGVEMLLSGRRKSGTKY